MFLGGEYQEFGPLPPRDAVVLPVMHSLARITKMFGHDRRPAEFPENVRIRFHARTITRQGEKVNKYV